MSFWNNPENSSLRVLLLVIVVAALGSFTYYEMHQNGGEKGQVASSTATQTHSKGGLNFMVTKVSATTCAEKVWSDFNPREFVTLAGTYDANGDCVENVKQADPIAQGMVDAMNASQPATTATQAVPPGGLNFMVTKVSATTCTEKVWSDLNPKEFITLAGTYDASGTCVENAKQANPTAQGMANAIKSAK